MLGGGLVEGKLFEQSLPIFDKAVALAAATPETGYQFPAQALRAAALLGLGRVEAAQAVSNEMLREARNSGRRSHEVTALRLLATVAVARKDEQAGLAYLTEAISLAESAGLLEPSP